MAGLKKQSAGKKAMLREARSKQSKGQNPRKALQRFSMPGKAGAPETPEANKKLAHASRKKQVKETPDPGSALNVIPKPTALPKKKRKGAPGGPR